MFIAFVKKNIIIIFELNNWFLVEVRDWFNGFTINLFISKPDKARP